MDWDKVSTVIPSRSKLNCKNKWKMTQSTKSESLIWTENEDSVLESLVNKYNSRHWKNIVDDFNNKFSKMPKTLSQCRDRWHNYLNPEIKR